MPLKYQDIWGADIIIKPGEIYSGDPEFVGVMPVRQDIEILPADEPRGNIDVYDQITISSNNKTGKNRGGKLILGWTVKETIGIGVVNTKGVASGRKSVVK